MHLIAMSRVYVCMLLLLKVVVGSTLGMNYMDYPSIIVYGHYDVQPVDPLDEWLYDPFDMRMGDMKNVGKVYLGRGVSDDKGGTWSVISSLAMINNVLKGGLARLPINIILVIEGEEEIGSPGFRYFLEQNKEMFRTAEMVISVDGGQPHRDKGSLTLSFRGMMAGQIDVKGADIDLHSGKVRVSSHLCALHNVRRCSFVFPPPSFILSLSLYECMCV